MPELGPDPAQALQQHRVDDLLGGGRHQISETDVDLQGNAGLLQGGKQRDPDTGKMGLIADLFSRDGFGQSQSVIQSQRIFSLIPHLEEYCLSSTKFIGLNRNKLAAH